MNRFDDSALISIYGFSPSWHDMEITEICYGLSVGNVTTIIMRYELLELSLDLGHWEAKGEIVFQKCFNIELSSKLADIYSKEVLTDSIGLHFALQDFGAEYTARISCESCIVSVKEAIRAEE